MKSQCHVGSDPWCWEHFIRRRKRSTGMIKKGGTNKNKGDAFVK